MWISGIMPNGTDLPTAPDNRPELATGAGTLLSAVQPLAGPIADTPDSKCR